MVFLVPGSWFQLQLCLAVTGIWKMNQQMSPILFLKQVISEMIVFNNPYLQSLYQKILCTDPRMPGLLSHNPKTGDLIARI